MKKFNLSGRRQFKKEPLIANQKLKTDVNRGVCYPRLRDFFLFKSAGKLYKWPGSKKAFLQPGEVADYSLFHPVMDGVSQNMSKHVGCQGLVFLRRTRQAGPIEED